MMFISYLLIAHHFRYDNELSQIFEGPLTLKHLKGETRTIHVIVH